MNQFIEIFIIVMLTFLGYAYIIYANSECKINKGLLIKLKPNSFKKNMYLTVSLLATVGLFLIFNIIYSGDSPLHHMKLLCLISLLFPVAVMDYTKHIIPNKILLAGLALRIIFYGFEAIFNTSELWEIFKSDAIGALVIGLFFLICVLISKNSIGMGDIKLFALMGLYQGLWGALSSVFISLIVSFFLSIGLLILRKKGRKDVIPFGPSILIGTYITLVLSGM